MGEGVQSARQREVTKPGQAAQLTASPLCQPEGPPGGRGGGLNDLLTFGGNSVAGAEQSAHGKHGLHLNP